MHVWRGLDVEHEVDDIVLHLFGKFHMFHDAVDQVKFFVEVSRLFVDLFHESSHVTEDEGRNDCTSNDNEDAHDGLC